MSHISLHAHLLLWEARHLTRLMALLRGHVACGEISKLLLLLLETYLVRSIGLCLLPLEIMRQRDRLDLELAARRGTVARGHGGSCLKSHRRHLLGVRILGWRHGPHSLRGNGAGPKVLILHGRRWSVGKALLESELGLL